MAALKETVPTTMTKNWKLYIGIGLIFAIFGAWYGTRTAPDAQPSASPVTTTIAPTSGVPHTPVTHLFSQTLPDAQGKQHALAQWKGKPLIVNFWATWCGPCVQEMPELSQLAAEHQAGGLTVIGIGIDSPTKIDEFAKKLNISYPLYVAGMSGTELSRQFGNTNGGLPYTVLIGADGQVKKTYLGRLKFDELKADLAALKS
jgi:peroxiredoxin